MNNKRQIAISRVFSNLSYPEIMLWSISLLAMVLLLTIADESFYMRFFATTAGDASRQQYNSYLYHHLAVCLLLCLPLVVARRLKIADIGIDLFKLGDWRWGLPWTLALCLLMILPTWFSSYDQQFLAEYPLAHHMFENAGWLLLFAFSYVFYYIGWEGFFRGFIGFGLVDFGYRPFVAMMIQVSLSTIIHIGKPDMELIGAIPGGIIFGLLAYRSGSLFWPLLLHLFLGLINTWFCWLHQPFNMI